MKIKWRLQGFREIRQSAETRVMLEGALSQVMSHLDSGLYDGNVFKGRQRSRIHVVTADYEGILDNDENNSLLRALGGISI